MFTDLGVRLATAANAGAFLGASVGGGLDIVEQEITAVLKVLKDELTALENSKFAEKGHISAVSFGLGSEATVLANAHARAHGVVVETLQGLRTDLLVFQEAIADARRHLGTAEEGNEADLRILVARTEGLDLGVAGRAEAQRNHKYDTAESEDD